MAKPAIHTLTKKEIIYLATHRCTHGHTFLEHYTCYEGRDTERIGFFDIETSNLDADFGIILSYCIKDSLSDEIKEGVISADDIKRAVPGQEDKRVVRQCISDLSNFDKIVTFYGKRFDAPYVRTRAMVCDLPFPNYGTMSHIDMYFVIRHKMRLSSNRLENACRVILGHTDKTRVDAKYWRGGVRGDEKCLSYILDHNRKDVLDLEKLYHKTINFVRKNDTSI